MTPYEILVLIHVLSAILGLSPGFVLIFVVESAETMTQLRHAYEIRKRLHIFVMIGGTLLLITGLSMGLINTRLFQAGWYVTSLILFLIALAMGPLVLAPKSKPVKALLAHHKGENIPEEYERLSRKLFAYERIENAIFLAIIVLMVLKPF